MSSLLVAWVVVRAGRRGPVQLVRPLVAIAVASYAFLGVTNGSVAQDAPWYGHRTTALQDLTAHDISMTRYVAQLSGIHVTSDRELFQALSAEDLASGTILSVLNEDSWPPGSDPPYTGVVLREADFERSLALDKPIERTWWVAAPAMYGRIYDNGAGGVWLQIAGTPR